MIKEELITVYVVERRMLFFILRFITSKFCSSDDAQDNVIHTKYIQEYAKSAARNKEINFFHSGKRMFEEHYYCKQFL